MKGQQGDDGRLLGLDDAEPGEKGDYGMPGFPGFQGCNSIDM